MYLRLTYMIPHISRYMILTSFDILLNNLLLQLTQSIKRILIINYFSLYFFMSAIIEV